MGETSRPLKGFTTLRVAASRDSVEFRGKYTVLEANLYSMGMKAIQKYRENKNLHLSFKKAHLWV
jgi:hypothetical protein